MTIKSALWLEMRYGSVVDSHMSPSDIAQDVRSEVGSTPYIVIRRASKNEDNQVTIAEERFEFEIIGEADQEDTLEAIRDAIVEHFTAKVQTVGQYTADGTPDASTGLKVKGVYVNTVDGFTDETEEKVKLVLFDFTYWRG